MHILGAGRSAFLEFLRNLTPIALIGSVAVVAGYRLDFARFDAANWRMTAEFVFCTVTAILAFFANLIGFMERSLSAPQGLEQEIKSMTLEGSSTRARLWMLVSYTWNHKPLMFVEIAVVLAVVYSALFGLVQAVISVALTVLNNGLK